MSAAKQTRRRQPAKSNGTSNGKAPADQAQLVEAIAHEEAIREDADAVWAEQPPEHGLTPTLYRALRPLLRKPIPPGFIQHVGVVTGKPYESTGVRSVQVQIDRLDNVLGPDNWGYEYEHFDEGKRCHFRAWVGPRALPLVVRESDGGVNQGSTIGNIYKGSFTNAAKPGLARLGPAWEVYVGATDFDPDTDADAAKQQGNAPAGDAAHDPKRKLPPEKVEPLRTAVIAAGLEDHLEMKLGAFGVSRIEDLTVEQALGVYEWAKGEALGG